MKRLLLVLVAVICLVIIGISPGPGLGSSVQGDLPQVLIYQGYQGSTYCYGTVLAASWKAQTITVQFPVRLYAISVLLQRYHYSPDYSSHAVAIELYECTGITTFGPALAYKLWDSTTVPQDSAWHWEGAYAVNSSIILLPGHTYMIKVTVTDGDSHVVNWDDTEEYTGVCGTGVSKYDGGAAVWGDGLHSDLDMCFFVDGWWEEMPAVVTLPATYKKDNSLVMAGMVTQMGYDTKCRVYMDYGWSSALGNSRDCGEVQLVGTNKIPGAGAYNQFKIGGDVVFQCAVTSLQPGMVIYYQARMVGEQTNTTAVGVVLNFTTPGRNVGLTLTITQNDPQEIDFEVWISDLGNYSSVGLNISYGLNYTTCWNSTKLLLVTENATSPGSYNYTSLLDDDFTYGESYVAMANMIYEGQVVSRSDPLSFRRYDPNMPGWMNWLDDLLGGILGPGFSLPAEWIWWGLAAIAGLVIFFLVGRKKGNWRMAIFVGIGVVFALLYIMLALELVNPWLVVLLTLLAGYLIWRMLRPGSAGANN